LFQLTSISIDHLLFLDDQVPLETLYNQRRLRLNLVDHHLLKPSQAQFSSVIERVIDHHLEENVNYPNLRNENKTLCKTGSNITLIAEKLFENLKMTISPEFALLLLGPILIDTSCLNSVEKTTERDIKIAHDLTTLASAVIPNDFYEKIFAAKIDISGLTPSMLLIRDYKEYRDNKILYGISSLSPLVDWTLDDLRLIREDIEKYAFDRHLTYLIILMSSNEPQAHRKVFIYSRSINLLRAFEAYLKTDPVLKDLLAFIFFSQELQLSHYIALRPLSRKDLQPLLHFSEISKIQF
jgi:exopolyphosphatase